MKGNIQWAVQAVRMFEKGGRTVKENKLCLQLGLPASMSQKLRVICTKEMRSLNRQVEFFCRRGIERYERENGVIGLFEPDDSEK